MGKWVGAHGRLLLGLRSSGRAMGRAGAVRGGASHVRRLHTHKSRDANSLVTNYTTRCFSTPYYVDLLVRCDIYLYVVIAKKYCKTSTHHACFLRAERVFYVLT